MEGEYLDAHEAAALLRVSVGTVRRWAQRRQIPHLKLGRRLVRFDRAKLEAWAKSKERATVESKATGGPVKATP